MEILIRGFLFLSGAFIGCEGLANVAYWHHKSRLLFQLGRGTRMFVGFALVTIALIGGA